MRSKETHSQIQYGLKLIDRNEKMADVHFTMVHCGRNQSRNSGSSDGMSSPSSEEPHLVLWFSVDFPSSFAQAM